MIEKLPRLDPCAMEVGVRAFVSEKFSKGLNPRNAGGNGHEMRCNIMAKGRERAESCNGKCGSDALG